MVLIFIYAPYDNRGYQYNKKYRWYINYVLIKRISPALYANTNVYNGMIISLEIVRGIQAMYSIDLVFDYKHSSVDQVLFFSRVSVLWHERQQ